MRTLLLNEIKKEMPNSQALGAFNSVMNMSNTQVDKNIDIVQKQKQIILDRGNPKTGIRNEDKKAFDRLESRERMYFAQRGRR